MRINGTRFGDVLEASGGEDDLIHGGAGRDTIVGGAGNDGLDGGNDADVISGGYGADTLLGRAGDDSLDGGLGDDRLIGGAGQDTLVGGEGDDSLYGETAGDRLVGGPGSDRYVLSAPAVEVVEAADDPGHDHVFAAYGFDGRTSGIEAITLIDGDIRDAYAWGNGSDNLLRTVTGRNDRLYGGAGNDTLLGGVGNNYIDGESGDDVMAGGRGNDVYIVDSRGDRLVEHPGGGIDTVFTPFDTALPAAIERLTLTGDARIGTGNAAANYIEGSNGDDRLQGLGGNDNFQGANGDDWISGGSGNDSLGGNAGDDTLIGGAGNDTLMGSYGNDTYVIADAGDVVNGEDNSYSSFFGPHGVSDTARAWVSVDFSAQSQADIENILLLGTSDLSAARYNRGINDGTLRGNDGDNRLDGSARADDLMLGGRGDDTYVVENPGDVVIEGAGAGSDRIESKVSFRLSAHVETLKLLAGDDLNAIGNGIDNLLLGNSGDNHIAGREGSDTLTGGAGADSFIFDRDLGPDNVDTITDLSSANDSIVLRSSVFAALDAGPLDAGALRGGTEAQDADDRIIYDRATGELFYDADGAGGADQVLFAVLENRTLLSADVFEIV